LDTLSKAGCGKVFTETAGGALVERASIKEALAYVGEEATIRSDPGDLADGGWSQIGEEKRGLCQRTRADTEVCPYEPVESFCRRDDALASLGEMPRQARHDIRVPATRVNNLG
jgi:hypothetical protein